MSEHLSSQLVAQISALTSEFIDMAKQGSSRFCDSVRIHISPSTISTFFMILANFIVFAVLQFFAVSYFVASTLFLSPSVLSPFVIGTLSVGPLTSVVSVHAGFFSFIELCSRRLYFGGFSLLNPSFTAFCFVQDYLVDLYEF